MASEISQFLQNLSENLYNSATVKRIYGDPISVEGRTIVPVAKIRYGFGGGSGPCRKKEEAGQSSGEGGGGGGGIKITPVGVVEISGQNTTYIPVNSMRKAICCFVAGLMLGLCSRRWCKPKKS